MLKFTKYGKTTSTRSLSNNVFAERSTVVLTSFKEVPSKMPVLETVPTYPQVSSINRDEVFRSEHKPSLLQSVPDRQINDSKQYLQRSKVSKEELMKLDFDVIQEEDKPVDDQCDSRIHKIHIMRPSRLSDTGSLRRTLSISSKNQVPVYNDGYFPKVPPISRVLSMKSIRAISHCSAQPST